MEEKYASGEVLQVDQLKALVLQHQKAISEVRHISVIYLFIAIDMQKDMERSI